MRRDLLHYSGKTCLQNRTAALFTEGIGFLRAETNHQIVIMLMIRNIFLDNKKKFNKWRIKSFYQTVVVCSYHDVDDGLTDRHPFDGSFTSQLFHSQPLLLQVWHLLGIYRESWIIIEFSAIHYHTSTILYSVHKKLNLLYFYLLMMVYKD